MSKARNIADLLDASGDVKSGHLDNIPTYSNVSSSAAGLMTPAHKSKLDGLATVATSGSYADLTNVPDVSASSLSSNFTVASGKTVTAGTFANLNGGEIGTNPVANNLGTEYSHNAETSNYITGDGKFIVRAYSNGSGQHCVKTINTANGNVVGDTAVYTGYTFASTNILQVTDNRFVVYGTGTYNSGNANISCSPHNWTGAYHREVRGYLLMVEISSAGAISNGAAYTMTSTYTYYGELGLNVYKLGDTAAGFHWYKTWKIHNCRTTDNYYYTFPTTGGLNISTSSTSSSLGSAGGSISNTAGTKLLTPSTSTAWNICDISGHSLSNHTTITNNRTNLSSAQFIKPDSTQDKLLCFYINTNLELCVETLDWTSSAINVVANSKVIIEVDASGVSLGSIKGSTAGVGITYENGSKGRFKTLSLDSNMVVTGQSSVMTVNDSNVVPGLAYKGNDVFQVWNNNVDTYTRSVTVNAYSTSPLKPLGVINANGSGGDSVSVTTRGVASGFTGLTPDTDYYYDTSTYDGTVTTTNTGVFVGRAVSSTEILLTDLTEQ